ncbi:hypothetical protein HHI_17508 [Hyphomonas hirschiana VP5]|uniref:Uncharacterized protein n=1 Tax=Hyphomonas hirschiana VP5 TaxID=1280951 RepID=A0A059F6X8_9PROT|nr:MULTISPECIES: hypothetical protein [Hyphomonas]KCZ83924.1 hypothetical protein HHI_17508 [Hyphomonas hirschiana VP5]
MEAYIPLIVSALGGTILGPVLSKLMGGSGAMGIIGGILGGIGAHYGADAAGAGQMLGSTPMMIHIQNFLEGGIGGGILGLIAGAVSKQR